MADVKTTISFGEMSAIVNKVVGDCFPDDIYTPINKELSLRVSLLCAFAPDFDMSDCVDNNALWKRIHSDEAERILGTETVVRHSRLIEDSINKVIDYRVKLIASGGMSATDIALSKIVNVLTEKIEKIDTSMLSKKNIDTFIKAMNTTQDNNFAENLVDVMLDKGLLAKPNRETRRKNVKQNKKAENTDK